MISVFLTEQAAGPPALSFKLRLNHQTRDDDPRLGQTKLIVSPFLSGPIEKTQSTGAAVVRYSGSTSFLVTVM
jgi:hypothetical protein